jgi:hypothetical protein
VHATVTRGDGASFVTVVGKPPNIATARALVRNKQTNPPDKTIKSGSSSHIPIRESYQLSTD